MLELLSVVQMNSESVDHSYTLLGYLSSTVASLQFAPADAHRSTATISAFCSPTTDLFLKAIIPGSVLKL